MKEYVYYLASIQSKANAKLANKLIKSEPLRFSICILASSLVSDFLLGSRALAALMEISTAKSQSN